MDYMFAPSEAVWLLALIYQPIVLIYYIINDEARKPDTNVEGERRAGGPGTLRSIVNIFSLSLSGFTIVAFSKILLMNVFGIEALIYMLGNLLLLVLMTIAYMASFFATLNAKKLVYFVAFLIGAIITYAVIIPSWTIEGLYNGEFYQLIIPFLLPGFIGFAAFVIFVLTIHVLNKMGKATIIIEKISQPLWDKRRVIKKVFGFYFHLIIWIFLVFETALNQSGYTIFSW